MVKTFIKKSLDKGRRLINDRQEGIISAAFLMMILLGLTKIVGFVKIHFLARIFGASRELDIFWAAFTVPDVIFNIVAVGSINAALIPSFAEKLKLGDKKFQTLFRQVLNLFFIVFVVFGLLVLIFAPQIAGFLVDGGYMFEVNDFTASELQELISLMRIMTISPIILGISSIFTAGLHVNKRFVIPSLAPLFYNLGILFGALVLTSVFNLGIAGLAWGVLIGSIMHLLIQLPLSKSLGLKLKIDCKFYSKDVVKVIKLAIPRFFGLLGEQIGTLIDTIIAMGLGAGALSSYKFGLSLHLLPVQIIGSTISQAALPTMALEYEKDKSKDQFVATFVKTLNQILFLTFPAIIFMVILRLPIVRLVLGAGQFDWEDTVVTSWVLALLGISVLGQVVVALVVRAFYAMKDTKTPVYVAIIGLVINVVASIYFTNFFSHYYDWRPFVSTIINNPHSLFTCGVFKDLGSWFVSRNSSKAAVGGVALGSGFALIFDSIALLWLLNKKIKVVTWNGMVKPTLKKFLASLCMGVVTYGLYKFWNFSLSTSTVISIVGLFFSAGSAGLITYFVTCWIIDVKEFEFFWDFLKCKLIRVKEFLSGC